MRTVHIVPGDSSAGSLQQALGFSAEHRVLGLRDALSVGPLPATSSLEEWAEVRHEFWRSVGGLSDDAVASDALPDIQLLSQVQLITLWLGSGLEDQMALPWLRWVLRLAGVDQERLGVVQFPPGFDVRHGTPSVAFLAPEQIKRHPPVAVPSARESATIDAAWHALTSSTPLPLLEFLRAHSDEPLSRALRHLARRYPQRDTGLGHWDRQLLLNAVEFGPDASRIIGHTLSDDASDTDPVGDLWLLWRLRRLGDGSLPHPLVAFDGDPSDMKGSSVRITDAGRRVVSGGANAVELNGIDDWVGGVHLSSSDSRVWFASGEQIIG